MDITIIKWITVHLKQELETVTFEKVHLQLKQKDKVQRNKLKVFLKKIIKLSSKLSKWTNKLIYVMLMPKKIQYHKNINSPLSIQSKLIYRINVFLIKFQ